MQNASNAEFDIKNLVPQTYGFQFARLAAVKLETVLNHDLLYIVFKKGRKERPYVSHFFCSKKNAGLEPRKKKKGLPPWLHLSFQRMYMAQLPCNLTRRTLRGQTPWRIPLRWDSFQSQSIKKKHTENLKPTRAIIAWNWKNFKSTVTEKIWTVMGGWDGDNMTLQPLKFKNWLVSM